MTRVMTTRSYSKSRLKAHMLEIFRELEATGEEAVVTDHGRPVLRIVPVRQGRSVDQVFANYRHGLHFTEDPNAPTTDEWGEL